MKPAALAVSDCAAVLAKPRPRGASPPSCLENNNKSHGNIWTAEERHPLLVFAPLPLNPQTCPFFPSPLSTATFCPLQPPRHVSLSLSSVPASDVYLLFFSPSFPPRLLFLLPPSLRPLSSLQPTHPNPPRVPSHSVSVPGHRCQQLERITANCATCGPLKGRKTEEEGRAPCQTEVGFAVCARARTDGRRGGRALLSILDAATKHSV